MQYYDVIRCEFLPIKIAQGVDGAAARGVGEWVRYECTSWQKS